MIKCENIQVMNFEGAIRGMRNPLESWDKSDSYFIHGGPSHEKQYVVDCTLGPNDLALAQRLVKAGNDESKFMRQIFVTMDITAPRGWWP